MTIIWGNSQGFIIVAACVFVSVLLGNAIEASVGHGYFLAISTATIDLLCRYFLIKPKLAKLDIPKKKNGKVNAEAIWLTSGLGPSVFSIPIWIGAIILALSTIFFRASVQ